MPFNIDEISKTDPIEISITFSNEDFTDVNQLYKLKQALQHFKKVKFKLEEGISVKAKSDFIQFTIEFLKDTTDLLDFDISENNLSLTNDNHAQIPIRGKGRGLRTIRTAQDPKKIEDLLTVAFNKPNLQTLNLSNSCLDLEKESVAKAIFPYIRKASRQYTCIDLRNTHHNGQCFTLNQLYLLVQPKVEEQKPISQVLVSYQELPKSLQEQCSPSEYINLADMSEAIIATQRKAIFKEKIDLITTSPSAEKPIHIEFESPLESLTDEETRVLADALQIKGCKVSRLSLPPCGLAYLTPVIKEHLKLIEIDFSKLGFASDISASLSEIVATNTKIQRVKCNYQLFLKTDFQYVIKSIVDNSQSRLKRLNPHELKYIELIDNEDKLRKNPTELLALIVMIQKYSTDDLHNIQIVIDLSILEYDLQMYLASKKLLHFPENGVFTVWYEFEEEEQRSKPLLSIGGTTKFILSPCYETHTKIMTAIFSYLQQKQVSQEQPTFEENQEDEIDEVGDFHDNVLASSLDNDPEIQSTGDLPNDSHCLSEHLSTIEKQQPKTPFLNLDKNKVETASKIIFEKLRAFIQQIKNEEQPFEVKREDGLKIIFEVSEIQDCLSQMEQELSVVENEPFYNLEWNFLIPLTDAANGQNYFGRYFNVRKLDLIEAIINNCFGNIVCRGSFKPTMMPINNHVPGKICIEGIAQIVDMYSESVSVQVSSQEKNFPIHEKESIPLQQGNLLPKTPYDHEISNQTDVTPKEDVTELAKSKPLSISQRVNDVHLTVHEVNSNQPVTKLPTVETKETKIAKAKFTAALEAIEKKATKLQETADKLYDIDLEDHEQTENYYKYKEAAKAATSLHYTLKTGSELYFKNGDKQAFKDIANTAITTARNSELKNHRGYLKQILGYSGLAVLAVLSVATLGLAYAAAGGINYAINRQFFFSTTFNTDSINLVDDLENSVDAIAPTA